MKQADHGLDLSARHLRKRQFLEGMEYVVPWPELMALVESVLGHTGCPPTALASMLRINVLQQWLALSDPVMEEAQVDVPLSCEFARLPTDLARFADESTTFPFRRLLEAHGLVAQLLATVTTIFSAKGLLRKSGVVVDSFRIGAAGSSKNAALARAIPRCLRPGMATFRTLE